ncbi:MAG: spermidine synthase [Terriglobales bacterium]
MSSATASASFSPTAPALGARADLFLVSFLILFLELACIRWFPAHVLYLTFFTNTVLMACFLGMSVGCLAARRPRAYLKTTPVLLLLALAAGQAVESARSAVARVVDVGNQASPQLVYFGTEYNVPDLARFVIPIEALAGTFFLLLALVMLGPGQELGRCLDRVPGRVEAYTLNILGSLAGIVFFAACSWWQLPPLAWFLIAGLCLGWLLRARCAPRPLAVRVLLLVVAAFLANARSGEHRDQGRVTDVVFWSPYYRVDYNLEHRWIVVNQIGHQQMTPAADDRVPAHAYALPHLLQRDSGRPAFEDVLIIGAGSGNDVAQALRWGARRVDAVEIDPVIQRLGRQYHTDRPYDDSRVAVHLDDGRNFLRSTTRRYDLIIYALVDSLVLHSSYSNLRLESYLFTREAFADVRRLLKPGGVFAMYNYFRQGWIVARLSQGVEETFGERPLIMVMPYRERVEETSSGGFTLLLAGQTAALRDAFQRQPEYWLPRTRSPHPESASGFQQPRDGNDPGAWLRFGLATLIPPAEMQSATDEWPFLYLRRPMIPGLAWRGMAIMGSLALVLIMVFLPRTSASVVTRFDPQMFFLGAGFLLIETKAVVQMALLFGSTWMVNSVVFFAVLVMILLANLYVLRIAPTRLGPYYAALFAALALNCVVPLNWFLGMGRMPQVVGSCVLVFLPILFAGIIFAAAFRRTVAPDLAFGANIAGAMLGGLAEYTSMLLGFRYLMVVAIAFYAGAVLLRPRPAETPVSAAAPATS